MKAGPLRGRKARGREINKGKGGGRRERGMRAEWKRRERERDKVVLEEILKITCRDVPVPRTDFLRGYLFDIGSSEARHRNERKV